MLMLTWPRPEGDFGEGLIGAERCLAEVAAHVSRHQSVLVVTGDDAMSARVSDLISGLGGATARLHFHAAPANDIWARDHGPITVFRDGRPVLYDFVFDGWGRRHDARHDNAITGALFSAGAFANHDYEQVDLVLEGGAIDSDGAGSVLTTARCLYEARRNPGFEARDYAIKFLQLFDITRVIALTNGEIIGDDTDGHVDMLARFTSRNTIVYQSCGDPADRHFEILRPLAEELKDLTTADASPYEIVPLPFPDPVFDAQGQRLPASYANFLICNSLVLVPGYHCAADEAARRVLAGLFADRDIITVDCRALIAQGGSLHCATMQIPAGGQKN